MAAIGYQFVGRSPQKLLLSKTLSEAFASVVERLYARNRREMAQQLGLDQRTVENVRIGKAGAAIITKALIARKASHDDAWDMADAILEQVLGESRSEYEERKLSKLIGETENARTLHEARRARRQALAERAALVDASLARAAAEGDWRRNG